MRSGIYVKRGRAARLHIQEARVRES